MTQHDRIDDEGLDIEIDLESEGDPTLVEALPAGARGPVRREPKSGIAPRNQAGGAVDEAGRSSLYERLQQSGALDDVMAVAAREQAATGQADAEAPAPSREAVPSLAEVMAALARDGSDGETPQEPLELSGARPLLPDQKTPPPLPSNMPTPDLPSVILGPGASSRGDSTQRVVLPRVTDPGVGQSLVRPGARPTPRAEGSRAAVRVVLVGLLFALVGTLAWWVSEFTPDRSELDRGDADSTEQAISSRPAPRSPGDRPAAAEPAAPESGAAPESESDEAAALVPEPTVASEEETPARRPGRARAPRRSAAARKPVAPAPTTPESDAPQAGDSKGDGIPGRAQVVAAMNRLLPSLSECAGARHGIARLTLTVQGAGRVSHALVQGDFAGTPEGSCIARAVKQARFPAFERASVQLTYPVQL